MAPTLVSAEVVLRRRGYSLTISVLKCSTFYGLSAHLLMCEEITLFPTPVKEYTLFRLHFLDGGFVTKAS